MFRTKHRNNGDEWDEDIWSWSTYGTLRFYIKAPKAVTLRLGVTHQNVSVYDPHVSGCDRWEDYDFELTARRGGLLHHPPEGDEQGSGDEGLRCRR